jgi:hypothetical protein
LRLAYIAKQLRPQFVIPAKAGIHWAVSEGRMGPRFRGDDNESLTIFAMLNKTRNGLRDGVGVSLQFAGAAQP